MDSSSLQVSYFLPLLLLLITASGFSPSEWHQFCNTNFVCGNINTCYPFWGNNRIYGCGVPELELSCHNNQTTLIKINHLEYQVLEIDENAQTLKIARQDYTNGLCEPEFVNTTLDPELFEYAPGYRNLTVMYGCPMASLIGVAPVFSCAINGSEFGGGFVMWEANGPGLCYGSVYVPVLLANLATAVVSQLDLEESLKQGFEVRWRGDDSGCGECRKSKGACGFDLVANRTICYCPGSTTCMDIVPDVSPGMLF